MNPVMIISTQASQLARLSGAGCGETRTSSSNREVRGFIAPIDPTKNPEMFDRINHIKNTKYLWFQIR